MSDAVVLIGGSMVYFPELESNDADILMAYEQLKGL